MTKNSKTAAVLLAATALLFIISGCGKKGTATKAFPTATPTSVPHIEKIVYTYNGSLYQIDPEGTAKEELFPDGRSKWYPSVSPDGWHIAYWVFAKGNYNLWAADMRKRRSMQITFDDAPIEGDIQNFMINNSAAWTKDADNLIYSRHKDLWQINPEGYNMTAVTSNRSSIAPSLSASGQLYFSVMESKNTTNIFHKQLGTDQEIRLTNYMMKKAVSVSVSSDGKKVVYSLIDGDSVNIYKYDLDKKEEVPVTTDGKSMSPCFSKDASRIVFVSNISNRFQPDIWIMKADGTERRKITTDGGVAPAWLYAITSEYAATYTPTPVIKNIEKQMIMPTKTPAIVTEQKPLTSTSDNEKEMDNVTEAAADIRFETEDESAPADAAEPAKPVQAEVRTNTVKAQPQSTPVAAAVVKAAVGKTTETVKASAVTKTQPQPTAVKTAAPVTKAAEAVKSQPAPKKPEASNEPKPTFTPVKAVPYNSGGRSSSSSSW